MRHHTVLLFVVFHSCLALAASAQSPGHTGSVMEPFLGAPPFPNLICCPDVNECSDGDDVYDGCRMPDTVVGNVKLCDPGPLRPEYPFVCDYCPGGDGDDCDGSGWVEVSRGAFTCDGPVYRGMVDSVRVVSKTHFYISGAGAPSGPPRTFLCNDSDDVCQEASCFEQECIACAGIQTVSGLGMCFNEPGALCHPGTLEGSAVQLCCNPLNGSCIRPNSTTGDCSGHVTYDATYNTLASCTPCPFALDPSNDEACKGWDLFEDNWPANGSELGSPASISCSSEDSAGCKIATYSCDGTLLEAGTGNLIEDGCNTFACMP